MKQYRWLRTTEWAPAELTVRWLNQKRVSKRITDVTAYERVRRFIETAEQLVKLDSARNYPRAPLLPRRKAVGTTEQHDNLKSRLRAVNFINHVLRTQFVPRIKFSDGSLKYEVRSRRHADWSANDFGEAKALEGVLFILGREPISGKWYNPLIQCACCSTWTVRERPRGRFCSDNCRQAEYATSPAFKRKKRDYMRNVFRPREKRRAAAALAGVRRRR